jgi:hypothetical protein
MANVNITDHLQPGQSYTFKFSPTGINPFVTGIDITQDLQTVDYISNVSAQGSAGFVDVYVQFTYQGDGTDTVDGVAYDIANAVSANHFSYSLTFQNGTTGSQTQGQGAVAGLGASAPGAAISAALPSTTTLVLVVIGIALVVFVLSGGPSLIREAT